MTFQEEEEVRTEFHLTLYHLTFYHLTHYGPTTDFTGGIRPSYAVLLCTLYLNCTYTAQLFSVALVEFSDQGPLSAAHLSFGSGGGEGVMI